MTRSAAFLALARCLTRGPFRACRPALAGVAALAAVAAVAAAPLASAHVHAQQASSPPLTGSAWQPLMPLTTWARPALAPVGGASPILDPEPRIGMLWSAGNPAALPWEAGDGWAGLDVVHSSAEGEYRRPLDAPDLTRDAGEGLGWGRIDADRAAIGRLDVGRSLSDAASFAATTSPYAGSPFVTTDAELPALRRIDAALEGALGVRLGGWGLGVAAGYAAAEERTQDHPVLRFIRDVRYGASLGAVRTLPRDLRLGLHGRYAAGAETNLVSPALGSSEVRALLGYREPRPFTLTEGLGSYYRRSDGDGLEATLSLAGGPAADPAARQWVVFAGVAEEEAVLVRQQLATADAPRERWSSRGLRAGAALTRPARGGRLTLSADWRMALGEAFIPDLEESAFDTEEDRLRLAAAWRSAWTGAWDATVTAALERDRRLHTDIREELESDLVAWSPGLRADVSRDLGDRVALGAGYAATLHRVTGRLPRPEFFGELARELVVRELAYYTTPAMPQELELALRWRTDRGDLVLRAARAWASPYDPRVRFPVHPTGDRSLTRIEIGIRPR